MAQSQSVVALLRALVDFFADRPNLIRGSGVEGGAGLAAGGDEALRAAVTYVAGMTDRFACDTAVTHLGWPRERLPGGVGTPR